MFKDSAFEEKEKKTWQAESGDRVIGFRIHKIYSILGLEPITALGKASVIAKGSRSDIKPTDDTPLFPADMTEFCLRHNGV